MSDNEPDLAPVHQLHPDREVHEAVVVSDRERELLATPAGRAQLRREGYWDDTRAVVAATGRVIRHQRTRAGAKLVGRNIAYIPAGAWVLYSRRRDRRGAREERQMRAAEACARGDDLKEWRQLAETSRQARHDRRAENFKMLLEFMKALPRIFAFIVLGMFGIGVVIAVAFDDSSLVTGPFRLVINTVAWTYVAVTVMSGVAVFAVPALAMMMCWWAGRKYSTPLEWLAPETVSRAAKTDVTPERVILALAKLGITELTRAIKDAQDGAGAMLSQVVPVGCGTQVSIHPPLGVGASPIVARRELFAHNCTRHPHEVFMDVPADIQPPELRVWIANPGALDEPVGPSPLVLDAKTKANYKTGRAPWGNNPQGAAVGISLYQCHVLITGASNQGKTRCVMALALWLALDPTVAFWIADLKGIDRETKKSDWEPMRPIADRFVAGPSDEHVIAATEMVEDAVREMERRITEGGTWAPLIVIVDEAQKAFQCPVRGPDGRPYGGRKDTSRYYMGVRRLHDQGRVVDVLLWQGTQNPTNDNLPKLVREGAHIRGSLAVGSESVAKMAMGDEAFLGGAAPHQLRKGIDRGTVVVTGDGVKLAPGQSSVTVRTHYLDSRAAGEVAKRAMAKRENRLPPVLGKPRDLLSDVADVLSQTSEAYLPATDVVTGLRELTGFTYREYQELNGLGLAQWLRELGVRVTQSSGTTVIHRERIWDAINAREEHA